MIVNHKNAFSFALQLPKFHRSLCSQFNDLFSEVEGDSKKKEMTPVLTGERSK